MKKHKSKIAIIGLAVVVAIGGTLAYFNQTMTVENNFDTGVYEAIMVEEFTPADGVNWAPGVEVNKSVEVKNTGTQDLIVRVRFDEQWTRTNEEGVTEVIASGSGLTGAAWQLDPNDGKTTSNYGILNDYSVVAKNLNDADWSHFLLDGWWYYKNNLQPGGTTGSFLESVRLLSNADMGKFSETKYYTTAEERPADDVVGTDPEVAWVQFTGDLPLNATHNRSVIKAEEGLLGYSDAEYTLTITAQTVQATDKAVRSLFLLQSTMDTVVGMTNWDLEISDLSDK